MTNRRLCKVLAVVVGGACLISAASIAPGAEAAKPANPNAELQIHPGGGPSRFGDTQSLEAQVSRPNGSGIDGVEVDFEVVSGPGDSDGNSPQTPDLTCTTAGGDGQHPATCTVTYAEPLNKGGSDAVMSWIDADGDDSTVEADLGEGENENAPGAEACAAGSKGPGTTPEPDATDCVEKRWLARVATTLDLTPRATKAPVSTVVDFTALVRDQFGDQIGGLARSSVTVSFELLAGSAHDPGDGTDFSSPDLGTCTTGPDGRCAIPFSATSGGTDTVCAYLPGETAACAQAPDTGPAAGGTVVSREWDAPVSDGGEGAATQPPAAPVQPPTPSQPVTPVPDAQVVPHDESPERHESHSPGRGEAQTSESPAPAQNRPPAAHHDHDVVPSSHPDAAPRRAPARASRRRPHRAHAARPRRGRPSPAFTVTRRPDMAASPEPSNPAKPRGRKREHRSETRLAALSDAAVNTAHKLSFPLGLTLLVIAFLALQGRLDRRDPKLRLAPIDSKHDLVPFT